MIHTTSWVSFLFGLWIRNGKGTRFVGLGFRPEMRMLNGKRFEEKLKKSDRKWRKRKGGGFDFENIKILEKFSKHC